MGDRANIVIDMPDDYKENAVKRPVYLYTHWGGSELPVTLLHALGRRVRWEDESYLARIIFSEMIKGSERQETGFGISLRPPDNSYPYLRVDPKSQTVTVDYLPVGGGENRVFTFEEYISLDKPSWEFFKASATATTTVGS